jgi:hypothetical protein
MCMWAGENFKLEIRGKQRNDAMAINNKFVARPNGAAAIL